MARKDFWKSDWFLGVVLAVVVLAVSGSDLIQSLERKAYDLGVRASDRRPSERIAIIAIDDQSIANIGRWPWPRDVHAKLIDRLAAAKAKVIGSTAFFAEPQIDPGLPYIARLRQVYGLLSHEGQQTLHEFGADPVGGRSQAIGGSHAGEQPRGGGKRGAPGVVPLGRAAGPARSRRAPVHCRQRRRTDRCRRDCPCRHPASTCRSSRRSAAKLPRWAISIRPRMSTARFAASHWC